MKRAVLIGGFTTSRASLEPVANALCELGMADDVDIFPFPRVMRQEDQLRRATGSALVVSNSAGIMAVNKTMAPERLVAVNGPEPRKVGKLLLAAGVKLADHYWRSLGGPDAERYGEVLEDNLRQGFRELFGHMPHIRPMTRFSTVSHLAAARDAGGIDVAAIRTLGDTYYPHDPAGDTFGVTVHTPEGGHDALMIAPAAVLQVLQTEK